MPSFAESFIRGHARGSVEAERKKRLALDEEEFAERQKQNQIRSEEHKQQMEVEKAISTLNFQMKKHELLRQTKRPAQTAKAAGFLEQAPGPSGEEMGGPSPSDISVPKPRESTLFDMTALGGGKAEVPQMFAEDVAQQHVDEAVAARKATSAIDTSEYEKRKNIDESHEGFVLSRDFPQFGMKAGMRVNPSELAARASVFAAQEATNRKALEDASKLPDAEQADYLADQVLDRRLDYRSLGKDQKVAVGDALKRKGMDIPRPISTKEREAGNNALSGLAALDQMDAILKKNPHVMLADVGNFPGLFGAPMRAAVPEIAEFGRAKREVTDVITRLRTGAALNKQEESFYPRQVAEVGDSEKAIAYKHNQLRAFYLGMTGVPVKLISPDGTKSKTAQDMFDPKQRLGVRKLIDQGWELRY